MDWDALACKRLTAPFKPQINGETDVSNFSEEFTNMMAADSPAIVPVNADKIFKGYSYVAPSILFSENDITQDFLKPSTENRPNNTLVCLASQFKVGTSSVSTFVTPKYTPK